MNHRITLFLTLVIAGVLLLTIGKFGGERLRSGAVRIFSNGWMLADRLWRGELSLDEKIYEENRFLKKALKEIADGEKSASHGLGDKIAARVIYRPQSSWLSSFWIDLGSETGGPLIGINSPVLYRGALLGIIDYVGVKQSRVLLITDPKLRPAVRVARGDPQRFAIAHHLLHLQTLMEMLPLTEEKRAEIEALKQDYLPEGERFLLAKGELRGTDNPLSQARLKGVGFNLETADAAGPARDLRSGRPYNQDLPPKPLIQPFDLLVTSGLDGLFPEGIDVAVVTDVAELDEGDVAYEIQAEPLFGPLEEIRMVDILSPLPFDPKDIPPLPMNRRAPR